MGSYKYTFTMSAHHKIRWSLSGALYLQRAICILIERTNDVKAVAGNGVSCRLSNPYNKSIKFLSPCDLFDFLPAVSIVFFIRWFEKRDHDWFHHWMNIQRNNMLFFFFDNAESHCQHSITLILWPDSAMSQCFYLNGTERMAFVASLRHFFISLLECCRWVLQHLEPTNENFFVMDISFFCSFKCTQWLNASSDTQKSHNEQCSCDLTKLRC